jgi:mycothiol system anti-sigma-R factor
MEDTEANCRQVLAKLFLYVDGEVAGSVCADIESHLQRCADCLRHYGFERDLKSLVARTCGGGAAPEHLQERLLRRLNELLEG